MSAPTNHELISPQKSTHGFPLSAPLGVGAHWPVDVLAGAMTGWLCAIGGIAIAQRGRWGMRATAQQTFAVMLVAAAGVLLTYYQTGYEAAIWLQRGIALLVSQLPKIFNEKA